MKKSVAALCAALACQEGLALLTASSTTAARQQQAVAWLSARRDQPNKDELAELKAVNPDAYAIVKALLTKRSLGLLDPRHPSASFAAPAPQADAAAQGPEAFQKIAEESPGHQALAATDGVPKSDDMPYDVPAAPVHHDWLNWKPPQSATDDEAMVNNVLGAVASLKGNAPAPVQRPEPAETPTVADPDPAAAAAPMPAQTVTEAKPSATMNQENSYLRGVDFGFAAAPTKAAPAAQENSYLKGFNLGSPDASSSEAPAASQTLLSTKKEDATNYLAGFSFDDAPAEKQSAAVAAAPKARAAAPKPKNSLFAWLSGGSAAAAPPRAAPPPAAAQAPPPPVNSYLMDLN